MSDKFTLKKYIVRDDHHEFFHTWCKINEFMV